MAARATYRDCHGVGGGKNGKRKRYLERETGCNQTEVFCPGISSPWTYSEKGILCLPPGLHKELVTPALGRPTHPVPVHRKAICLGVGGVSTCAPAQVYDDKDYRKIRFIGRQKEVNDNFAIDLIAEQPVSEVGSRVIACDGGGGALGHPKVYINLVSVPGITVWCLCPLTGAPTELWGGGCGP
ncbi:NADH dehydrogenase [ubiquinone] iron-sulfur protein 6, mitochondrial isoform X2 [Manis javanica]|uniref:NADH dehydrogenase [ubiquinone] iron-sulfur protein 6, mitochondrial isoform X2 n=1 Tax=Manis javanica TaxID=9974 RepID=UPI003C6D9AEC